MSVRYTQYVQGLLSARNRRSIPLLSSVKPHTLERIYDFLGELIVCDFKLSDPACKHVID